MCWRLWNPSSRRNRASDQRLRRRRSPSRAPPLPSCAGVQSRATNLRSGRAHRSPRWLLLSRATFLGHPRDRPFFSSTLPTRRARNPEPGPRPFPVSLPLTHLVFVLPPFSVPQAGRSRRTDGKSRSCLGEWVFPKRWRKEPKLCQWGGVSQRNLRKEPKLGI